MQEAINTPYVKEYKVDEHGNKILQNPIEGAYRNNGSNRRNRREDKFRFQTNSRNHKMVTFGRMRYNRVVQRIEFTNKETGDVEIRFIEHNVVPSVYIRNARKKRRKNEE